MEAATPTRPPPGTPLMTVAIVHHHLRGYPEECLEALGAAEAGPDMEFLLVQGYRTGEADAISMRFPHVRVLRLKRGDRAAAKNLVLTEARGEFILLTTADTIAERGAGDRLREFIQSQPAPVIVSAQLLQENGMRRRTHYPFPSLLREANPLAWVRRAYYRVWRKGKRPNMGGAIPARAFHASFFMASRAVFQQVGRFTEGYRFAHEDIEWCWRAKRLGVGRYVIPAAHVFRMPPQLHGEVPPTARAAMTQSLWRLVGATRGTGYAAAYRGLTRAKSFCKWLIAAFLDRLLCGSSVLLSSEAASHGAIWRAPRDGAPYAGLSPDIESHVRWERTA